VGEPERRRASPNAAGRADERRGPLLPDLSIAENVCVGRITTRNGRVDRATMARRAAENLRNLGLDVPPTTLVAGSVLAQAPKGKGGSKK